uniref:F-box domain-containing protein n=1 Tax=Bursaphelenchus xylophilus TaxID=6326 RepID=A0A1I7RZL0_BURXY
MFVHSQKTEIEEANAVYTVRKLFGTQMLAKLRSRLIDLPCKRSRLSIENKEESATNKALGINNLPNEMLEMVFGNLDKKSLLNTRETCSRWANLVEKKQIRDLLPVVNEPKKLIIFALIFRSLDSQSPISKNRLNINWPGCQYAGSNDEPAVRELFLTKNDINQNVSFKFAFNQLNFQRLFIENFPKGALTDRFVRFLCQQFENCRKFEPIQLSLKNVDLGKLSSDVMKSLLTACAVKLEVLEFYGIDNVAPDLITDEHVLLLGSNKVRRLSIQFKDEENMEHDEIQLTDTSLETFTERGIFPAFTISRCMVTVPAVCSYVTEWLNKVAETEALKSHSLTLSDCPNMSEDEFEAECQRHGLNIRKHVTENTAKAPVESQQEGSLCTFTVTSHHPQQTFNINLFTAKSE